MSAFIGGQRMNKIRKIRFINHPILKNLEDELQAHPPISFYIVTILYCCLSVEHRFCAMI